MKKTEPKSSVIEFLRSVWNHTNSATENSFARLNTSMRRALALAIGAGFTFKDDDFEHLDEFRYGRWIGDSDEWCYSQAIADGNYSAANAYEAWKGRSSIIADNVTPHRNDYAHLAGERVKERLHVGARFKWKGQYVTVTSFTENDAIACSYHPRKEDSYENKVKNRFRISRDAIIEDRAERKVRREFEKEFSSYVGQNYITAKKIMNLVGAKTKEAYDTIPIKRLEKAAKKIRETVSKAATKKAKEFAD